MSISDQYEVIATKTAEGMKLEVVQFADLHGAANVRTAEHLFFAKQSGMRVKMIKVTLTKSSVRVEPGSLYYMRGNLEIKTSTGGGLLKGLSRKILSGETLFINEIHGTGEIFLEPSYGHFLLRSLTASDESLIVDKGMFFAGSSAIDVSAVMQKNVSSALFGGEGLFQTQVQGEGIAAFFSPVPEAEIQEIELKGEKLSIDGNFSLMRTAGIAFKAEKSSKTWISTSVSSEGLLQTFEGTGKVWIAPTQGIYKLLSTPEGIKAMAMPPGTMETTTTSSGKTRK